jgi:hypothetical protein
VGFSQWLWIHRLSQVNWFGLHLYWGRETILKAFCSSALWQIYQTLYLFFRMQKCRFTAPSLGAGMQASNSSGYRNDIALLEDGKFTHLP